MLGAASVLDSAASTDDEPFDGARNQGEPAQMGRRSSEELLDELPPVAQTRIPKLEDILEAHEMKALHQ